MDQMDLLKQVGDLIGRITSDSRASEQQSSRIAEAARIFDDLAARGLVDAPSYRLAPMNAIPPKATVLARAR